MLKDLAEMGQIVRHAAAFNPRHWKGGGMASDVLLQAVERLFALLDERGVDYVLVGGIALLNYVEGRNTQDIDLIMALPDLSRVPEIEIESHDSPYFARGRFAGLHIDILLTENPLFRQVQREYAVRQAFLEQEISVATVEGLLLLKLYALPSLYRQGSFVRVSIYENDIASLMYAYRPDMEHLIETLSQHVGEGDIASVREIVEEIERRIRRFEQGREG